LSSSLYSQNQPIDVTDQTIKLSGLGGEQTLYYGFNAGDQIVFNFNEVDGKELKEVEIAEYPSPTKFADYKISQTQNKIIVVARKGIWTFHFANSALAGRVCHIKIQRIPANDAAKDFNTDVIWKNWNDTNYTEETERYLVKSDTTVSNFLDEVVTVHSRNNSQSNKNITAFTIPENTIAWAYYIGVNEQKSKAFTKATVNFTKNAAKIVSAIPEWGVMASFALNGIGYFEQINSGDAVDFYIVDNTNATSFQYGRQIANAYKYSMQAVNNFSKMTTPLYGSYFLCLQNDNLITPINVTVKMTAIIVKQQWGTRPVKKMSIITKHLPFNVN